MAIEMTRMIADMAVLSHEMSLEYLWCWCARISSVVYAGGSWLGAGRDELKECEWSAER
jgi:hypothetical protein